ncbi:MAG: helix-turn-helix domain-containing protein [Pseudomonadota bacterium]
MTETDFYIHCIEKAVVFIGTELRADNSPTLDAIASAAGLSKFHFHRIYRLLTGETVADTITRMRLARGATQLSDPEVSVTEAAFDAGYGSSQAFAKALRRVLDSSPSELRTDPERLAQKIEPLLGTADAIASSAKLLVELSALDPFEVIAIKAVDSYPELNANYHQLFGAVDDPMKVSAILGMPQGDIGEPSLLFDCALKLGEESVIADPAVVTERVRGGIYLTTRHDGAYAGLENAVDRLYATAFGLGEAQVADQPLLFHYLDDPEEVEESALRTDVYLGLTMNSQA